MRDILIVTKFTLIEALKQKAFIVSTIIMILMIVLASAFTKIIPKLANNKLGTLCEYFDIKFEAHDSMEDIIATKALIKVLLEKLSRCRG